MKIEKTPLKSDFLFSEKTQYSLLVSYNVEKSWHQTEPFLSALRVYRYL